MQHRIIFIHGNQTLHWSSSFAPWLKTELEKLGFTTFFETFPDSIIAREEYWISFLEEHIHVTENDILLGWSSGAVAAMRFAETHKIKGSILISPSHTDLGDELERQSGYFTRPWDWEKIRNNQKAIALCFGDDDPYIPQKQFFFIAKNLQPETIKISGGGHFNSRLQFPEILTYIKNVYKTS